MNTDKEVCTYCKSDDVFHFADDEIFYYKGNELHVLVAFSLCLGCGREFISKEQIQANDARLKDAKKWRQSYESVYR